MSKTLGWAHYVKIEADIRQRRPLKMFWLWRQNVQMRSDYLVRALTRVNVWSRSTLGSLGDYSGMFLEEFIEKVGQKGIHPAGGSGRLPAEGALLTSPQGNLINFGLLVGKCPAQGLLLADSMCLRIGVVFPCGGFGNLLPIPTQSLDRTPGKWAY